MKELTRESMESILRRFLQKTWCCCSCSVFLLRMRSILGWSTTCRNPTEKLCFFCRSFRTTAMEGIFQALYGCGAILLVIKLTKASFMYQCSRNLYNVDKTFKDTKIWQLLSPDILQVTPNFFCKVSQRYAPHYITRPGKCRQRLWRGAWNCGHGKCQWPWLLIGWSSRLLTRWWFPELGCRGV